MPKADVLQLVADLSAGLADQTASSNYYDDIVNEMGLGPSESLTNAAFVQVTKGVAQVLQPINAVRILMVVYDDTMLQPSDVREAWLYDNQWRTTVGEPRAWLTDQETRHTITLVPVPKRSGQPVDSLTPFDTAAVQTPFPEGNLTFIYTESRVNVQPYEELIVALQVLVREFDRESDHTDHEAAQYCGAMAGLLETMLSMKR